MPRLIEHATDAVADLADLVDFCRSDQFDPASEDGIAAAAPVLRALGNNGDFLANIALDALKARCREQSATNNYSAQVLLLHPPEQRANGEGFFIRANIWPSERDPAYRSAGAASFFYNAPHDHSFDFLTLGYLGPGYWSDYYEVEPDRLAGMPGERIDLRFVERSQLSQGKMLLYRANRDVHDQMPPERLSVSINVMPLTAAQAWRQQYLFDVTERRIVHGMTVTSAEMLLGLAVLHGNGLDLAEDFAGRHPDPRMRLAAWSALDAVAANASERLAHAERALAHGCALIRAHGARTRDSLRNGVNVAVP